MTHDPLCLPVRRWSLNGVEHCDCPLIARVREDEQNKYVDMADVHWQAGYGWGVHDARGKAEDALLGTLTTTRDRVLNAIDSLKEPQWEQK